MEWLRSELDKMEHNKMFTAKTLQQYRATPIQLLTHILFTEYNFFQKDIDTAGAAWVLKHNSVHS